MKFGLLWHSFSSGNLGVGALSISNMLLIDEAARKCGITPEFLIIGSSGPCDYPPSTERFKYEFIEFNEQNLFTPTQIDGEQLAADWKGYAEKYKALTEEYGIDLGGEK